MTDRAFTLTAVVVLAFVTIAWVAFLLMLGLGLIRPLGYFACVGIVIVGTASLMIWARRGAR